MKNKIFVVCILLCYVALTKENAATNVETTVKVLDNAKTALDNINKIIVKANPGKIFAQVSQVLVFLGPAMMAVSAVMSVVAIFLPQEDSPELQAIKEGFEQVNRKLDVLTSEIKDLRTIIELSSAKSAYVKDVTAINSNYEAFEEAVKGTNKASYDFFVKQYDSTYNLAASNMYDAMTGVLGPFGFNLVNLYKDYVKCNPVLISTFCTLGMQLITKGLVVEGGYFGTMNLTSQADKQKEKWETKMQTLADSCRAVIQNCEDNWKIITAQQFRETYNKEISAPNNQDFAQKIADSLVKVAPQRGWLVVSYDDATGYRDHAYSSNYDADKLWNANNKDVTVFSAPFTETLTGSDYLSLKAKIDEKRRQFSSTKDCILPAWRYDKGITYEHKDLRPVLNLIRDTLQRGVIYIVKQIQNPGYVAIGNTFYGSELEWKCTSKLFRLLIFV